MYTMQIEKEQELLRQITVGGYYRHYKNKEYKVIGFARDSETLKLKVVYQALYSTVFGDNTIWVRDLDMFLESVEVNGVVQPRFKKIDDYAD